jgi:hypothetical protein
MLLALEPKGMSKCFFGNSFHLVGICRCGLMDDAQSFPSDNGEVVQKQAAEHVICRIIL